MLVAMKMVMMTIAVIMIVLTMTIMIVVIAIVMSMKVARMMSAMTIIMAGSHFKEMDYSHYYIVLKSYEVADFRSYDRINSCYCITRPNDKTTKQQNNILNKPCSTLHLFRMGKTG